MASQYTRLPVSSTIEAQRTSNRQHDVGYELESIRHHGHEDEDEHEHERYEPFASRSPAPYMSPLATDDLSHAPCQSDAPESKTTVSSITHPISKTAVTSITSLTSQHGYRKVDPIHNSPVVWTIVMSWLFELLAVLVSTGSLLAIIAILHREDGRPLAAWKLAVTLNTVIATLGTLARTTLAFALSACVGQQKWNWLRRKADMLVAWERFDEASRGPWGASRLFIWLRARHWAALGALVVMGTVAFDPFLQAVLSTDGQLDVDTRENLTSTSIPQALVIDAGTTIVLDGSMGMYFVNTSAGMLAISGTTKGQPDFGMISAIYNGFHNNTSWYSGEQVVNSVCTSGNCTWPTFVSAAICSSCNDVSDQLTIDHRFGNGVGNIPLPNVMSREANYTAFTLRNGNISNADISMYTAAEGTERGYTDETLLTANTTLDAQETTSFQDLQTMLQSFIIMRASEEWMQGNITWNASRPVATECALYLCSNMYQAESLNSKLVGTRVQSWAIRDKDSYKADPNARIYEPGPAADAYTEGEGDKLYDQGIPRADLRLLMPPEEHPELKARTVNVTWAFIRTMSEFLSEITAGSSKGGMMVYPASDNNMSPLVNALWDSKNLTETFDHVARSLTNQVRNTATNASHINQVPGTSYKWIIHVKIQWAYLAFPIAMVSLGIIYILLTIIESTRLQILVWKESALPSLLYGLDNEAQSLLRNAHLQPNGAGQGMTVRFGYDEKDDCHRLIAEQDPLR